MNLLLFVGPWIRSVASFRFMFTVLLILNEKCTALVIENVDSCICDHFQRNCA